MPIIVIRIGLITNCITLKYSQSLFGYVRVTILFYPLAQYTTLATKMMKTTCEWWINYSVYRKSVTVKLTMLGQVDNLHF